MKKIELELLKQIWGKFFQHDKFIETDRRLSIVDFVARFFESADGNSLIPHNSLGVSTHLVFDVHKLSQCMPFDDFGNILINRPVETVGCIGLALSLLANTKYPYSAEKIIIRPRFLNLPCHLSFGELKSDVVGKMVSITGHVIRVSAILPLVERAGFYCPKCEQLSWSVFDDGVFSPPDVCPNEK
jgi:DNA replicative helicase MCM subunit Mcm2 (Cdc46/Mcm family)